VIGVVAGAVTQWFPSQAIPASTSGGPWVLISFLVALTAAGVASATARGLACMAGLAIGYYGVAALHGFPVSSSTASFWLPVALLIGPLTGLAAGWIRSGPPLLAQVAAGGVRECYSGKASPPITTSRRWLAWACWPGCWPGRSAAERHRHRPGGLWSV
jgi:hypothetical protein